MRNATHKQYYRLRRWLVALSLGIVVGPAFAAQNTLIQPQVLVVDHSLPKASLAEEVLAARRYDTFWDSGDEALARSALAPDFIDNTLPSGRGHGQCLVQ